MSEHASYSCINACLLLIISKHSTSSQFWEGQLILTVKRQRSMTPWPCRADDEPNAQLWPLLIDNSWLWGFTQTQFIYKELDVQAHKHTHIHTHIHIHTDTCTYTDTHTYIHTQLVVMTCLLRKEISSKLRLHNTREGKVMLVRRTNMGKDVGRLDNAALANNSPSSHVRNTGHPILPNRRTNINGCRTKGFPSQSTNRCS